MEAVWCITTNTQLTMVTAVSRVQGTGEKRFWAYAEVLGHEDCRRRKTPFGKNKGPGLI